MKLTCNDCLKKRMSHKPGIGWYCDLEKKIIESHSIPCDAFECDILLNQDEQRTLEVEL